MSLLNDRLMRALYEVRYLRELLRGRLAAGDMSQAVVDERARFCGDCGWELASRSGHESFHTGWMRYRRLIDKDRRGWREIPQHHETHGD